jgi:PAS domain S-box-containing protein
VRAVREVHRRYAQSASFAHTAHGYESLLSIELMPEEGGLQHRRAALLVQMDSRRAELELWSWAQRGALVIAAASVLAGVLIYLLLHRLVLAPIAHLERTIEARRHDEEATANEDAPGEFAALARNFNALAERNRTQREALASGAASLRDSRAQFQALVTASAIGIVVHREGVPVFANDAAAQVFGFEDGAALRALPHLDVLFDLQHDELGRARIGLFGSVSAHKPWELTGRAQGGGQPRVEMRARMVNWEGDEAVMLQFADVSDRHATELAMRRARDEAVGLAQLRSAFLANMSHELRTPMNGVIGMLALLRDTPLDEEQRELIEGARRSGEALLERVNDILEFSRLEAGTLRLVPAEVDLRELVDDAFEMQLSNVARKGIEIGCTFHLPEPCSVDVDPGRMRQVLVNLVGNAVKFTAAGEVAIDVRLDDTWLSIDVRDTGPGIQPEALEHIFMPFMQADSSTTRRFGGTGLGLSISRRLLELMGGELAVSSSGIDGEGSVFHARLPRAVLRPRAPAPDVPGPLARVCSAAALRSGWLDNALAALGWRCAVHADPSTLQLDACDVLIIDEDMLGPDVEALLAAARLRPHAPRVLLWSAFAGASGEAGLSPADGARFDGVLRRPLRLDILRARLAPAIVAGAGATAAAGADDARPGHYWRALVVDDVELNRDVLRRMLVRLGFVADTVNDGAEALAAVLAGDYDIVMMDGQMPVMDGFEATARIRALDGPRARVHIVAVTANAMAGDEERFLGAGMDDYLPKPVTLRALRDIVDRWLTRRQVAVAPGRPTTAEAGPTLH